MTTKVSNNSGLGDCGLMIHLFICIAKKNLYVNFLTCVHICVKVNHAVKSEKILHFTCAMILSNLPPNHSIACWHIHQFSRGSYTCHSSLSNDSDTLTFYCSCSTLLKISDLHLIIESSQQRELSTWTLSSSYGKDRDSAAYTTHDTWWSPSYISVAILHPSCGRT